MISRQSERVLLNYSGEELCFQVKVRGALS